MFELDHMKFENERKNGELEKVSKKKKGKKERKGNNQFMLSR
jgi:hypothetical protein